MNAMRAAINQILLPIAASAALAGCTSRPPAPPAQRPVKVVVAEARKLDVPIFAASPTGVTKAIEEVIVRARVKGFLKEKHFKDGANVKQGDLLLVIDEQPFKVKLQETQAKLAEAKAALSKSENSKGVEVAKAKVDLEKASLQLAQLEAKRERALLIRNATPKEEVDRKDALQLQSQAQVESATASLDQSKSDYDVNISSARAAVMSAQAAVDNAEIDLGYCRMYAPITGRVGELKVKVGNLVGGDSSTELLTIDELDPMGVEFRPSSRYLPRITKLLEKGLAVELIVQGEGNDGEIKHPHPGQVYFLDNNVELTTSTVLLKAKVPNPDFSLLPGMYVKAIVKIGEVKDALVIPERAIIEGQEGSTVFVVDDQGLVDRVKVKLSPSATLKGLTVVESGLAPGQKVVVDGIQLIRKGQKVEPELKPFDVSSLSAPAPASAAPR